VSIGHVDAGKSTLMGRVLHELGETEDRVMEGYQRASSKMGKGSFAYAWTFDALEEERERYVSPPPFFLLISFAHTDPRGDFLGE